MSVGVPFQKHSPSSKQAAVGAKPYLKGWRYKVWKYIHDHPRCTDKHIVIGLQMNPNTARPRRVELESAGLIRPDGQTKTPSGSEGVAWVVTDKPYPNDWKKVERRSDMRQRRAERPTAAEFATAVEVMREAHKLMKAQGKPFPPEAVKVCRWLARQT
jgi:hypothetical protein